MLRMLPQRSGFLIIVSMFIVLLLAGCATNDRRDPLESVNRTTYSFNKSMDSVVLKPVAQGYKKVVPSVVRIGVHNFFTNLKNPSNIVNNILQADFKAAGQDTIRFAVNSTLGWGGVFDLASHMGLPKHREDFGQTLATWGYKDSNYIVLPFLGASTVRDTVGRVTDGFLNPLFYSDDDAIRYGLTALEAVDNRSRYLHLDNVLESQVDEYAFIRGAYYDKREVDIHDGMNKASDDNVDGFEFKEGL